ncbi:MAG: MBL fold metallo-hydrolase [Oscillospiraceae bacterium]|nr:MBL fold metallo-hydrolase [Oscillospiraceae bacterium]
MKLRLLPILTLLTACAVLCGCGADRSPGEAAPSPEPTDAPVTEELTADFLSTGKSDCTILRIDGLTVLIDTADADDYDAIAAVLRGYGVRRIDYIILSHYDRDHIGAAPMLIRDFEVGAVLRTRYIDKGSEYNALVRAEEAAGTQTVIVTEDCSIATENGTILIDPPDRDYGDDNNNTQIVTVAYKGKNLLFLGDAKKARLEEFLLNAQDSYELIKLPHHGDSNKALLSLLRSAPPVWAVEMVSGEEIVEEELLKVLGKQNVTLLCTADGPVRAVWDGEALTVTQ